MWQKKACPSALGPLCLSFKTQCLPPHHEPFCHGLKSTFSKGFLSLFHLSQCKGYKLHPAFVCPLKPGAGVSSEDSTCRGWGSSNRCPPACPPTHGQQEKAQHSFGECVKHGFLEHGPHSDYTSSVCLMLPKWESSKCERSGQ